MTDAIRRAFKSSLPSLGWMDENTVAAAKEKVPDCVV